MYFSEQFTRVTDADAKALYAALVALPSGTPLLVRSERVEPLFGASGNTATYATHVRRATVAHLEDLTRPFVFAFEFERIDRGDEEDVVDVLSVIFRADSIAVRAVERFNARDGERIEMSLEQFGVRRTELRRLYVARIDAAGTPTPLL